MAHFEYSINDGKLEITNSQNNEIVFSDKPLGYSVIQIVPDPEGTLCAVLLSYKEGPKLYPGGPMKAFDNLICVNNQGTMIWRSKVPGSGVDFFTNIRLSNEICSEALASMIELNENKIVANCSSGFVVQIDWETGMIEKKSFFK